MSPHFATRTNCFRLHTCTFQLLDKPWSQVSSLLPFGSAIPLLVDFSLSVANTRSRAFRESFCALEKVPTNLYEYACMHSGGLELMKLTYTRVEDNLIRHRGDRTAFGTMYSSSACECAVCHHSTLFMLV